MWMLLIANVVAAECAASGALSPDGVDELSRTPGAAALDSYLFPAELDREDPERIGIRTDGVVIVHHGRVVYERYGGEWTADRPHLAWSASKSFTNALTGIAVGRGRLVLDASICDYRPATRPESCAVRVQDVLEFASGFDWHETYEGQSPTSSSVLAMLYGEGERDMYAFVTGHALRDPPGTSWMYSSGDTNVLSGVVRAALEPQYGEHYPWKLLFEPLDMRSARWERDGAGTYVGSSYVYATPRDLAKFGLLYLQDGCYAGQRLLPEGWVASSTQVSAPMRGKTLDRDAGDVQGRQFWLNQPVPEVGQTELPWPGVPEDAYAARGHWKQSITMIPSRDLVVVRVADDRDGSFDHAAFLALAVALTDGAP
jgi:CubicO group peptidase (beta-lactamase class C family)